MPATNPGTTNLVAWWSLDETSGTRADSHGSNDLTDNNTVGYIAGKQGNAASFVDANSEYLSIADNADVSIDGDFTMCGWINVQEAAANEHIWIKWGGTANEWYVRTEVSGTDYRLLLVMNTGGSCRTDNGAYGLDQGTWHFIYIYYDASAGDCGIGHDGGAYTTDAGVTAVDSDGPLVLNSNLNAFDGYMDEVCIYKRVLSSDELTWLYNSGSGRSYADLTASAGNPLGLFAAQQRAMYAYGGVSVG